MLREVSEEGIRFDAALIVIPGNAIEVDGKLHRPADADVVERGPVVAGVDRGGGIGGMRNLQYFGICFSQFLGQHRGNLVGDIDAAGAHFRPTFFPGRRMM